MLDYLDLIQGNPKVNWITVAKVWITLDCKPLPTHEGGVVCTSCMYHVCHWHKMAEMTIWPKFLAIYAIKIYAILCNFMPLNSPW